MFPAKKQRIPKINEPTHRQVFHAAAVWRETQSLGWKAMFPPCFNHVFGDPRPNIRPLPRTPVDAGDRMNRTRAVNSL
jgi:hypothetical protein